MLVNLQSVIRGHQHFLESHARMVQEASERAARHAVDHVQKYPGFKPRTGKLQKSMRARVVRTSGGKLIRITNPRKYAQAIDTGAKPHVIRPRRRQFLRFRARSGQMVFARRVNHPGNRPYKFGWKATHSAHRVLGQELEMRMRDLAKRF